MEKEVINNVEAYQLSINQMNLWSVARNNMQDYYNQVVIELGNDVTTEKLQRGLAQVISKNETLLFKMNIASNAVFPVQTVSEISATTIVERTVQTLDQTTISAIAQESLGYDYDPLNNDAIRFCLLRDLNGNQVLAVRLFSLWADSYSTAFFCNELSKAISDETSYEKEEREVVEYQDFSAWQQQLFSEPEEEGVNFWKNYTRDLTKDIVPFKHKTNDVFAPQRKPVCIIEGDAYNQLKAKSIQEGSSAEHVVLSQFATYLSRFEADSFTLGYLPYNRYYKELENTFGLVSKTLPVHVKELSALPEKEAGAFFKKSVEEIGMWSDYFYVNRIHDKEVSDATIFKYVFEFLEVNKNTSSTDLKIRDVYSVTDVFELKLSAVDYGDKLVLDLYYDSASYSDAVTTLIVAQLKATFTNQNTILVGQDIIDASNNTVKFYELFNSVTAIFEQQVLLQANNTALYYNDLSISYKELKEKSNQFAHYLIHECGIKKGNPVAVLLDRSPDFVISVLGILKAGAYYIPMDTAYPKDRIQFILEDAACTILVSTTDEEFLNVTILNPSKEEIFQSDADTLKFAEIDREDIAYCIYTSGSTGNPKGCLITHANLLNYIQWSNAYYFGDAETGNWALITSISFDLTITSLFTSLTRGKKLWIGSDAKAINELLTESFTNPEIDTVKLTPSHLSLLKELNIEKTNIKIIIVGGEQLTQNQLQNVWNIDSNIRIINEYGPTETTVGCIVQEMTAAQSEVRIGKPIANTVITIVDSQGNPCDIGMYGEIIISGAGVAKGYLNRPELNNERFVTTKNGPSYKTGDIARWMDNGEIIYKQRRDDQVKIRGYRIELSEIEQQLLLHNNINQAVAIVDARNEDKKELIAYIVCSQKEDVKDIKKYLAHKLPEYMIPSVIIAVDTIPLTVNGKVDKNYLLTLNTGTLSRVAYVAPADDFEKQIAAIWEEVLQIENIGTQEDFLELGGHSLKAIQLINQYHKIFDVKLGLKEVFANTTIKAHATLIKNSEVTKHTSIQKIANSADYPASAGQRRLWVLSEITGNTAIYNMPSQLTLKGTYDVAYFSKAIEATLDRHEALRTTFKVNKEGEVRQVVKTTEELGFTVDYIDYRSDLHQDTNVDLYIKEDAYAPFDLTNGPLVRASILQLSDDEYVFYYNIHHIISDGWSMDVLAKDVFAFYEQYSEGKQNELTTLKIQYRDYAAWQQNQLQQEQNNSHKDYWLKSLAGELPTLDLPYQKARPPIKTYAGNNLKTYISPDLTNRLRKYGQNQGGSLFIGLLAVWNVLFHKYTAGKDVIIGTPVAGRDHADLNDQIGFYINMLPLRNTIDVEESFESFYNTVKEKTIQSYEHQMYPFDSLVDDLDIRNDTSKSAIFDVMLVLQNIRDAVESTNLNPGAFTTIEDKGYKVAKFDMDIAFQEQGDYLSFNITYNTDIYAQESVCRIIKHYKQLLEIILENPDKKIKDIAYIPKAEIEELIFDFNDTAISYPTDKTLIDLFVSQVMKTPENKALFFKDLNYTYQELDTLSSQFANCLRVDFKVAKGDFIGVQLERDAAVIIAVLGIMKAGAVYIPIDTAFPESRKSYIYEDTKIKLLITDQCTVTVQDDYNGVVLDIVNDFKAANYKEALEDVNLTPNDLAYIIYTSGSTGNPKGVKIGHQSLLNFLCSIQEKPGVSANDVLFSVTTYSFDISILEFFVPLLSGAALYMVSKDVLSDPNLIIKKIEEIQPTIIQATPSFYQMLFNADWKGNKGLKVLCGGDLLSESLAEKLISNNLEVWNMYGPTETTIWSSIKKIEHPREASNVGKPINNTQFYILDDFLSLKPIGIPGALYISGDGLSKGYLNRSELTAQKFIEHPYKKGELLYETGDFGKWLPDGSIEFLGRKDDQVKISGYRIELGEIGQALMSHDQINEAVVVVDIDEFNVKSLKAYIIITDSLSLEQLRAFLKNRIPYYSIPSEFIALKQLPITINGKIDKKKLANALGIKIISEKEYVAPETQKEKVIIQIIANELRREASTISILDNFFDMGANSIKIFKILNEINKELGVDVRIVSLFENPNVEEFVQYLNTVESSGENNIEELEDISEALDEFINLI
ncbi:amino acid adenylation domain-containing protein [Flavobacterium sp. ZT3R18]|uniref:non-ribosomal peptide synthetase n=1 Tax=Flavobacterium sp. ZT3R18 TaxID=2594429 RepID=UPI00117AB8C0|nr:non-ribosomal peptide synthetase [Flavobacterium sp. ZT3R18]TRX31760.1 amino acid adenylation domain-containing protein [Flavobacterium sp. ZT3R18]